MRLHDLLGGCRDAVLELRGAEAVDVGSVVHDSRDAAPGALFACVPGATTDGHEHAAEAVRAGAAALLVERMLPLDVTQVRVPSVRAVLGRVAARFHGDPSRRLRVLGVTGTNGKTTTTYLLEAIARAAGHETGLIGTVGTRIGRRSRPPGRTTPEATDLQALFAEMVRAGVETVAMEVSSHALVQHRVDATSFGAACFTNLSHDHLDYHGSMDAYFDAKAMLFTRAFTPAAAVNLSDPYGLPLTARARADGLDVWTFARDDEQADISAADVQLGAHSSRLRLVDRRANAVIDVETPLLGGFNVANALAAAATARAVGFTPDDVVDGLHVPVVVPGRFERIDAGQPFTVLVDYAHTPDALTRVCNAARSLVEPGGALVVVFGCGGDRDRAKRPLMGAAATTAADRAYLTSDNPRSEDPEAIAADVLAGVPAGRRPVVELDRRRAIRAALASARPGDVVVIAGKGHETGQTANGVTTPFDDRVVAREELGAQPCA